MFLATFFFFFKIVKVSGISFESPALEMFLIQHVHAIIKKSIIENVNGSPEF